MAKRIEFAETGGPEVLKMHEFEPEAPGPREVRVTNWAIGLNFIDIYVRTGLYPVNELPSGLGTEGAGVIEAVGEEVKEFREGDRVAYATGPLGAYATHHTLPADNVVMLPDSIGFDQAAAAMLKGLTVQYLLRQVYQVKSGDTFLFHAAAGGVGLIACQWARSLGARLIGTVSTPEKAELARKNGAWATINYSEENVVERVRELTDGQMCPVVYDSVGRDTWERSLDCLAPRGLMVSFGNASGPVEGVNLATLNKKGSLFVTRPSLAGYADTRERLEAISQELFQVIANDSVHVNIGCRFRLDEAGEAQENVASRRTSGSTILIP
ncbi:NADPH:quinone reductase [Kushneria marisflavi]|uniref:NADPH:quinone reductase n=1 Tax=Kushneria marisflavi TaxID=157779 RepID=A0A240UKJ6_9GAMM|nr:NADPH:quinone reductase [Kushneria marisflavi]ART62024.1 quinone oxidoreductase [Kushneria marisflavi]RKD87085.1 NADPH:quinone reductase-like Zn-dependent oxidoreductase [Kushneria marisflavi]